MFEADSITEWVVGRLTTHLQSIHRRLFAAGSPDAAPTAALHVWQARQSSPLREEIALLCRVANGQIERAGASAPLLAEIAETVQGMVEATAGPPVLSEYAIAPAYFDTPIGALIAQVQRWQHGDDLISFMEAGRLLVAAGLTAYQSEQLAERKAQQALIARVRRLGEAGTLRRYRNLAAEGPERSDWLVSRREVEAYIERRRGAP